MSSHPVAKTGQALGTKKIRNNVKSICNYTDLFKQNQKTQNEQ